MSSKPKPTALLPAVRLVLALAASVQLTHSAAAPASGSSTTLPVKLPFWSAPKPDGSRLQGYTKVANLTDHVLYRPTKEEEGLYNHAAMIMYHKGVITVSWKNAPLEEDTPGQRVLYSQSSDGVTWSKAKLLFPTMNSKKAPSAQFAGPFAVLNGRLYASASPAVISLGDAQGSQFCQWPDGLDPRNCNCPGCNTKHKSESGVQPKGLLMLREVREGGELGPVFWGTPYGPPKQYKDVAAQAGVQTLQEVDAQTRADVSALSAAHGVPAGDFTPPCNASDDNGSGTLKCEACPNGCQIYADSSTRLGLANERAHYPVPGTKGDVMLFRAHNDTLFASVREDSALGQTAWSAVTDTTIPNDNSNLNAGVLPGGRGVFLLSNAAPARQRDPLTLSLSKDGFDFSVCKIVQTCTDMAEGASVCGARQKKNGNVGPSYPQGLSVVAPAPPAMQGLYVVATNNKEDVVVTRVPWAALLRELH